MCKYCEIGFCGLTDETNIKDIIENGSAVPDQQEAIIETPDLVCQVEVDTPNWYTKE